MSEALIQALQLTVFGMGMTFASIGALALGMLVMTYLTKETGSKPVNSRERGNVGNLESGLGSAQIASGSGAAEAAAAAVAVALANQDEACDVVAAQAAAAAVAVSLAMHQSAESIVDDTIRARGVQGQPQDGPWNSFVRGQHLSRRARYESRRFR